MEGQAGNERVGGPEGAAASSAWAWLEPGGAVPPPAMFSFEPGELVIVDESGSPDAYLVCPACGATMYERGCKLRCRCGYFLSCSDI